MGERKRSERIEMVERDPPARTFLNHGRLTGTSRIFSQSFVDLSPLNAAIIDKAELYLTAHHVSPGRTFV